MTEKKKDLIEFPTEYTFKAFGPAGDTFVAAVKAAASKVVTVSEHAIKVRPSSGGKYVSVNVMLWLESMEQVTAIYKELQSIPDIKYIL